MTGAKAELTALELRDLAREVVRQALHDGMQYRLPGDFLEVYADGTWGYGDDDMIRDHGPAVLRAPLTPPSSESTASEDALVRALLASRVTYTSGDWEDPGQRAHLSDQSARGATNADALAALLDTLFAAA